MNHAAKAPKIGATVIVNDRRVGPMIGTLTSLDRDRATVATALGGSWAGSIGELIA